jgi:hypothetical protein
VAPRRFQIRELKNATKNGLYFLQRFPQKLLDITSLQPQKQGAAAIQQDLYQPGRERTAGT